MSSKSAPLVGPDWPAAGDAWVDHVGWLGPHALDVDGHRHALATLVAELDGVDRGVVPSSRAVRLAAARLGLRASPPRTSQVPAIEREVAWTAELARVALDYEPDAGELAVEAVLGPWARQLDLRLALHRRAWVAAVACSAFADHPGTDHPPLKSWLIDRKRRGSDVVRERMLAFAYAPPAPWRLVAESADGWQIEPCLPMHPGWVPSGPVDLSEAGGVDGGPAVGALLWARLVPTPRGHVARAALVLPRMPPRDLLVGAFVHAGLVSSTHGRALKMEDVLRRAGHRMIRACHLWHAISGR